jgi:hypothetical protein
MKHEQCDRRERSPILGFIDLAIVETFVPVARELGICTGARHPRGFLAAYRRAGGDHGKLPRKWLDLRSRTVAGLIAAARRASEPWWDHGVPTRRHVALIMWAFSPTPRRLRRRYAQQVVTAASQG